jgi:hypothetical protein
MAAADSTKKTPFMSFEVIKAAAWGIVATLILAVLIVVGSRNLSHFDAVLVGYTFATLFAVFGITYRYSMWLQRPPTALYWRRGWQVYFKREHRLVNFKNWCNRIANDIALNRFILRRGRHRWLAHWLIMWGTIIAAAITFRWYSAGFTFSPWPVRSIAIDCFSSASPRSRSPSTQRWRFFCFTAWCGQPFWLSPGL